MPSKMWDEITYPFPNLNGRTVEVSKCISNFIPHFKMDAITYPYWDWSKPRWQKGSHRYFIFPQDKYNRLISQNGRLDTGWIWSTYVNFIFMLIYITCFFILFQTIHVISYVSQDLKSLNGWCFFLKLIEHDACWWWELGGMLFYQTVLGLYVDFFTAQVVFDDG